MFVPYRKIKEHYQISASAVRDWALKGFINYKVIKRNTRSTWLYDINSIGKHLQLSDSHPPSLFRRVLYARVSSQKQKDDLTRQIELLHSRFPNDEILSDIGSGLNDKRPGFRRMVELVCKGEISELVATYKDRITRFGFDLFEQICKEHSVQLRFLGNETIHQRSELEELQEDLLSIVNVFVARKNGKRSGQLKKERSKIKKEQEKTEKTEKETVN